MRGPRSNKALEARITPSTQILVSSVILIAELELLGEMANYRSGAGNIQNKLGVSCSIRK